MKKLLVICGPTASGKSALAVECARLLDGEILSCDAFLIYRGLNIGTAKPTKEEMGGIPHHMIDVAEPTESFSVSDFERMSLPIVEDILARGKVPILCGGTGFYINSILFEHAFGNAPADPDIRAKYEKIAQEEGKDALHALLERADPESAARLHPNDTKRVIRALEIFELTGRKKSEQCDGDIPRYPFEAFEFDYPREQLYRRIEQRVDLMMAHGLVEEVQWLLQNGVPADAQCMQGIGYKEVVESLKNGVLHSTMSDIIKKNTRNYAKRQETFFKKMKNLHKIQSSDIRTAAREVVKIYEDR